MADEAKDDAKKGSLISQIMYAVVIAILVGGTSPWWFNEFFKKPAPQPAPIIDGGKPKNVPPEPVVSPPIETPLEASRDFFVGRWRVEQTIGQYSESNNIDYYENGQMDGQVLDVAGGAGRQVHLTGTWQVERLSRTIFRLTTHSNLGEFTGKYKIIDKNHIQNLDSNYVAERVE